MKLSHLLKQLQELTSKSEQEELNLMKLWTLEDHCLTSMYKKFHVILPEALYIFARHAYVIEVIITEQMVYIFFLSVSWHLVY